MRTSFYTRTMTLGVALIGCGGMRPAVVDEARSRPRSVMVCASAEPGTYGVRPLGNKSGKAVDLAGTDDLLLNEMAASGCFTLVERDKVDVLVDEMRLCSDASPDREYFNCSSFAKRGKLLGISHLVLGDLVILEDDAAAEQIEVKLPGVGGVVAGTSYDAVAVELRVVEVETGKVSTSVVTHAVIPSDRGGIELSGGSDLQFAAVARARAPLGDAIQTMFASGVAQLLRKRSQSSAPALPTGP